MKKKPVNGHFYRRNFFLWKWVCICRRITYAKQSEMTKLWPLTCNRMEWNLFFWEWMFICRKIHICNTKWNENKVAIYGHLYGRQIFFQEVSVYMWKKSHMQNTLKLIKTKVVNGHALGKKENDSFVWFYFKEIMLLNKNRNLKRECHQWPS